MNLKLSIFIFLAITSCQNFNQETRQDKQLQTIKLDRNEFFQSGDLAPELVLSVLQYDENTNKFFSYENKKLSGYINKPVLLNFWASWCAPCIAELKDLVSLEEILSDNLRIVYVNCDPASKIDEVKRIIKEYNINSPVFLDPELISMEKYFLGGFPETMFLDKEFRFIQIFDPENQKKSIRITSSREWTDPKMIKFITEGVGK